MTPSSLDQERAICSSFPSKVTPSSEVGREEEEEEEGEIGEEEETLEVFSFSEEETLSGSEEETEDSLLSLAGREEEESFLLVQEIKEMQSREKNSARLSIAMKPLRNYGYYCRGFPKVRKEILKAKKGVIEKIESNVVKSLYVKNHYYS